MQGVAEVTNIFLHSSLGLFLNSKKSSFKNDIMEIVLVCLVINFV